MAPLNRAQFPDHSFIDVQPEALYVGKARFGGARVYETEGPGEHRRAFIPMENGHHADLSWYSDSDTEVRVGLAAPNRRIASEQGRSAEAQHDWDVAKETTQVHHDPLSVLVHISELANVAAPRLKDRTAGVEHYYNADERKGIVRRLR